MIEVGNWLARADSLGYLPRVLRDVRVAAVAAAGKVGVRDEGDDVHGR